MEGLIKGLEYVEKYKLSGREVSLFKRLIMKPLSNKDFVKADNVSVTSIQHTLQKMKLKGIIRVHSKDSTGNTLYTPVPETV